MSANELNEKEMEALGISSQRYEEIVEVETSIIDLYTGKYFAGTHKNGLQWTADFNHRWHRPYIYSGKVLPFNDLRWLMSLGYTVIVVVR